MGDCVQTVGRIYEAFGRRDIQYILSQLSADVAWEVWQDNYAQRAGVPWLAARKGRAAVPGFFDIIGGWEFRDFQVLGLMGGHRQVAAEISLHVRFPKSGLEFREEEVHLWNFDAAGKVSRFRHYADTAKHIAAAQHAG